MELVADLQAVVRTGASTTVRPASSMNEAVEKSAGCNYHSLCSQFTAILQQSPKDDSFFDNQFGDLALSEMKVAGRFKRSPHFLSI